MRNTLRSAFVLTGLAALALAPATRAQTPPLRILPLGDEITYGQGVPGGYRYPLYVSLTNAGYAVDYVGTRTDNSTNNVPFDANHQGQVSNWRISGGTTGLDETLYQWLAFIDDPDVVLLHIGANDTNSQANAISRLDALITRVATNRPYANIIVTTLLPRGDAYSNYVTSVFNPNVEAKVTGQRALGRKVHYLDMYAALTTNDLAGTPALYPSAAGYAKMADAWYAAITNIVGVYGDTNAPAISRALGVTNRSQVVVTFSKPVAPASATNLANYAVDGGLALLAASLSADQRKVTLTTSPQTNDAVYTLTVDNVTDQTPAPGPLAIAPGSTVAFKAVSRGYLSNVPESADYNLLYALDLPGAANYGASPVPYSVDNSVLLDNGSVSRVAYYVELQTPNGQLTYLWAAMDPFTNKLSYFGVPTTNLVAIHQKLVSNLSVRSNDPGITSGSQPFGNIEFWAGNYDGSNSILIAGSTGNTFDFGDRPTAGGTYGSMQIHNFAAAQTLFSFSNWGTTGNAGTPDIGIGTCPSPRSGGYDWTFANSAGMYTVKTLQVLIRRNDDNTPPALVSAQAGTAGTLVTVVFSEPLNPDSVTALRFALDSGVAVIGAALLPDLRTVNLITTAQPAGTPLTLTVNGVRDSAAGNAIAPDSSIAVAAPALPPEIVANVGAQADGYQLVYTLDIPLKGNFNGAADFYRYNQSLATGAFDRVAYYVELSTLTARTQYLWAAMDAFTPYRKQVGVPISANKAAFQIGITNLEVKCNVAGVSNGTFVTGGNLEFWASSYSQTNAAAVTNASNSAYDWGDSIGSASAGHGSMQIHNSALSHVLFGMGRWGTDNNTLDLGIGNRPGQTDKDWTNSGSSGLYPRRVLHVLVRPSAPGTGGLPPEVAANIPGAAGYQLVCAITNIPPKGKFDDATWASKFYAVDQRARLAPNSFSRVAYYMELQQSGDPAPRYVWTAFDAFTPDPTKIAIPTSGTYFQQKIARLDVASNVGGITTGTGLTTGNMEFWPSSYTATNALGIPGASNSAYDFGDGGASSSGSGHGSMQVHNYAAAQTLFAFNHFNGSNDVAVGIGNNPFGSDLDWTSTYRVNDYDVRRVFYVFVLPGGESDSTPPSLVRVATPLSRDRITVTFSEALSDQAPNASFAIDGGVTVTGVQLSTNKLEVLLFTSPMTPGQSYTLTVSGVSDRSSAGNLIVPGSTLTFTAPGVLPSAITEGVPEIAADGYQLAYQLAIQNAVTFTPGGLPYSVDESRTATQSFDRVAYCLELLAGSVYKWVYVSMDAYTTDWSKIGMPTPDRGAAWQLYVSNLNVYASANVANVSVTTGLGIAAGNIEFWPSDYNASNTKNIPGASVTAYDFGDSGGSASPGHGCMQVHNYAMSNTVFAINHFGREGYLPELGIGNCPTPVSGGIDWTFASNAGSYSLKNLYVWVRPVPAQAAAPSGSLPVILSQPRPLTVPERGTFYFSVQATGASRYQWRRDGVPLTGETRSYLEDVDARLAEEGAYDVLVYGSGSAYAQSQSAELRVLAQGTILLLK